MTVQFDTKTKKILCLFSPVAEPSFVFADVIRKGLNRVEGEDDKIYFFFTEVSVEYEFFGKLLIPRVARVCKVRARHHPAAKVYISIFNVFIFPEDSVQQPNFSHGLVYIGSPPCQLFLAQYLLMEAQQEP